jgi:hypothetical protein
MTDQANWSKAESGIQREIDALGWRDVALELRRLGYTPSRDGVTGDFIAQDDGDGRGPYIRAWLNKDTPCPLPELLRTEAPL